MVEFFNYAQLVIGPAGSGKSTYCKTIQIHAATTKRSIKIINLDPAAENIEYNCDINIKDLITVADVMEKKKLGPNGALVYCMDYLYSKFEWLETQINSFGDNQYFLIDCPGQLELFSHYPVMKYIVQKLKKLGMNIMSVFCLDSTFTTEYSKFISGSSLALASMIQLELSHINVLTKADLINNPDAIEALRDIDVKDLLRKEESTVSDIVNTKFFNLNKALVDLLDNYSLIELIPLNLNDEESINEVMYNCDTVLQFYENQEPKEEFMQEAEANDEEAQEFDYNMANMGIDN